MLDELRGVVAIWLIDLAMSVLPQRFTSAQLRLMEALEALACD